jgi:hypothetical protein
MLEYLRSWQAWLVFIIIMIIIIWIYLSITGGLREPTKLSASKHTRNRTTDTQSHASMSRPVSPQLKSTKASIPAEKTNIVQGSSTKEKTELKYNVKSSRDAIAIHKPKYLKYTSTVPNQLAISRIHENNLAIHNENILGTRRQSQHHLITSLEHPRILTKSLGSSITSSTSSSLVEYTKKIHDPRDHMPIVSISFDDEEVPKRVQKKQSKGEAECQRVIEDIYKRSFQTQVRLRELENPVTHRPLELDVYNADLMLAIEYHGRQHYEYVPFFHKKGKQELEYSIWKDNIKVDMCDQLGIYLITVPYTVPHRQIKEYIKYYLPSNVIERRRLGIDRPWKK